MFLKLVMYLVLIWVLVAQVCVVSEKLSEYTFMIYVFSVGTYFNKMFIRFISDLMI